MGVNIPIAGLGGGSASREYRIYDADRPYSSGNGDPCDGGDGGGGGVCQTGQQGDLPQPGTDVSYNAGSANVGTAACPIVPNVP